MIKTLNNIIQKQQLSANTFLLAISGGVDSMVLAHLFLELGYSFEVVHCNFQLREDAILDEQLVVDWCAKHAIKCHVKHFDTVQYMEEQGVAVQEAARDLRYAYFRELLAQHALDLIVTAHHAHDNIETVLFNLLRGTSIKGLTGMQVLQSDIFRPLLSFSKKEILSFAKKNNVSWREDVSNNKSDYSRNFLRNEMLPLIEKEFPNVHNKLLGTIKRLKDVELIYTTEVENRRKKLLIKTGRNSFKVAVKKLEQQVPLRTVIYELFNSFGLSEKQIDEVLKIMKSQAGSRLETQTHTLLNHRNHIVIEPKGAQHKQHYLINDVKGSMKIPAGVLSWEIKEDKPKKFNADDNIACVDATHLSFPLIVRSPRVGDYFYPLGMKKKKKLSRYFIDVKLNLLEKQRQWVIEHDQKNIWLVGHRIDDRFKITSKTKKVLHLKWKHD